MMGLAGVAHAIIYTDASGDHLWSNTNNWDTLALPAGSDNVVATNQTILIDAGTAEAKALTLVGSTLTVDSGATLDMRAFFQPDNQTVTNNGTIASFLAINHNGTFVNTGTVIVEGNTKNPDQGIKFESGTFTMLGGTFTASTFGVGILTATGTDGLLNVHGGTMTFGDTDFFDISNTSTYGNYFIDVANDGALIIEGTNMVSYFQSAISSNLLTGVTSDQVVFDGSDTIVSSVEVPPAFTSVIYSNDFAGAEFKATGVTTTSNGVEISGGTLSVTNSSGGASTDGFSINLSALDLDNDSSVTGLKITAVMRVDGGQLSGFGFADSANVNMVKYGLPWSRFSSGNSVTVHAGVGLNNGSIDSTAANVFSNDTASVFEFTYYKNNTADLAIDGTDYFTGLAISPVDSATNAVTPTLDYAHVSFRAMSTNGYLNSVLIEPIRVELPEDPDPIGDITMGGLVDGDLVFSWGTSDGQTYNVETNADLTIPSGWGIQDTIIGDGSPVSVTNSTILDELFYKVTTP